MLLTNRVRNLEAQLEAVHRAMDAMRADFARQLLAVKETVAAQAVELGRLGHDGRVTVTMLRHTAKDGARMELANSDDQDRVVTIQAAGVPDQQVTVPAGGTITAKVAPPRRGELIGLRVLDGHVVLHG